MESLLQIHYTVRHYAGSPTAYFVVFIRALYARTPEFKTRRGLFDRRLRVFR
jgi:hypothetical protein